MTTGYIVHYYIGNKKDSPYKLWIAAHDPEQAEHLCVLQAGHRHGYGFKITITGIETEDNVKVKRNEPVDKPVKEPEPELSYKELISSMIESNRVVSESIKHISKRRKKSFLARLIG